MNINPASESSPLPGVSDAAWRNRAAAQALALEIFSSIDENEVSVTDMNFDLLLAKNDGSPGGPEAAGHVSTNTGFGMLKEQIREKTAAEDEARVAAAAMVKEHMFGGDASISDLSDLSVRTPPRTYQGSTAPVMNNIQEEERQQKKSVRFGPSVQVRGTISLCDMTQDEIDATWITLPDKNRNQREMIRTIEHMRRRYGVTHALPPDDEPDGPYCFRGLEHMRHKSVSREKKILRVRLAEAVLDEQERQWAEEWHNSRELAKQSGAISAGARGAAIERAAGDAAYMAARRRSSQLKSMRLRRANYNNYYGGGAAAAGGPAQKLSGHRAPPRLNQQRETAADGEEERGEKKRRRSSGLSYEKHGDAVLNELAAMADELDREDDEADAQGSKNSNVPVISRIEEGIIRREIEEGNLQRNTDSDSSGDDEVIDAMEEEDDHLPPMRQRRGSNDGGSASGGNTSIAARRSSLLSMAKRPKSSRKNSLSFSGMRAGSLRSLMTSGGGKSSSSVIVMEEDENPLLSPSKPSSDAIKLRPLSKVSRKFSSFQPQAA